MDYFNGNEKEIGRGAQSIVYSYNGFAYKVYSKEYPKDWIYSEFVVQNELNKTSLPVIKYYKTDEPNIIKMDLINGITLADHMRNNKYKNAIEDIINIQKEIHNYTNVNLPTFKSYVNSYIDSSKIDIQKKEILLAILSDIPDKGSLLHLDLHFLNIMYTENKYYLIDWVNARIGNPIFDYARSYVIMNEFAYRASRKYLNLILKDKDIDTLHLKKAIYVMAILRLNENISPKTLELINTLEKEL